MSFHQLGSWPRPANNVFTWGQKPDRTARLLDELPGEAGRELRGLVGDICAKVQAQPAMVLPTLISAMATAVHGGRMVHCPDGREEPVACFMIVLAPSTSGKTRVHRLLHKAHEKHDTNAHLQAECESLLEKPTARLRPVMIEDATSPGLMRRLRGVGEAVSLSVSEGMHALYSPLFRKQLADLNVLYDGGGSGPILRGNSRVLVRRATLNLLIMAQPDPFAEYMASYGKGARGIGFVGRCLFAHVPPNAGLMPSAYREADGVLDRYYERVTKLLSFRSSALASGNVDQAEISFDAAATELWRSLACDMHHRLVGEYAHIQDAANRGMANAARIAGAIHAFFGDGPQITAHCLRAAWLIVQWHLEQFCELFPPELRPMPAFAPRAKPVLSPRQKREQREQEDATLILEKIAEQCHLMRTSSALKSKVSIRSGIYPARFRTALMRLIDEGVVSEIGTGARAQLRICQPVPAPASNF